MTKISELLAAARAKIADPTNWTQGAHARDRSGNAVMITSESAVCFCADGAIALAAGVTAEADGSLNRGPNYWDATRIMRRAAQYLTGEDSYVSINDGDGSSVGGKPAHEGILAVFDKAIDLAKSREELGLTRVPPR
ncbi:DUF6197 family protein [Bradyrhizobium sp. DASA03007]|uniref:DUF6197 family protein n=1 Tax=unclassified Bradyrhizobium TaxID=2631580 RepID=UPI003F6FA4CA